MRIPSEFHEESIATARGVSARIPLMRHANSKLLPTSWRRLWNFSLVLLLNFPKLAVLVAEEGSSVESSVSFRREVMAVLSKAGCSSGACHGNRNGKGGFRLSLRGEEPATDFATLIQDAGLRRIDRVQPDQSLLLLKPTLAVSHEGRSRFGTNSLEYGILRRWIRDGMHDDGDGDGDAEGVGSARIDHLEVYPREGFFYSPTNDVKLRVTARFFDGTVRDVTSLAVFEAAQPTVDIGHDGEVHARQPGETSILVRYLNQQTSARLIFVPDRGEFVWANPTRNNAIDDEIFSKLERLRLNPAGLCSDEVFVRRVYLDLLGMLPTAAEARRFVSENNHDKRLQLVTALLERNEFAENWALKWADLFRLEERALDKKGAQAFHQWLVCRIVDHTPLDKFVREIITARGSTYAEPAANWFRAHRTSVERAESAAQVFLGTRLQCAQCHNHPYERWTQTDYHDWTALFAKVDYKINENRRRDENDKHEFVGEQIVFTKVTGEHKNPRSGRKAQPRFLGEKTALDESNSDPMGSLAVWLTGKDHPLFARAQANRIWFHVMGRGLVEPIDDLRATNPASHPELMELLSRELITSNFDLRHVLRFIMNSRTYQLSSEPTQRGQEDLVNYSRTTPRRLGAEQLLDAEVQASGAALTFEGMPASTRAGQVPGTLIQPKRGRKGGGDYDQFLQSFGKPQRQMPTECERSSEPSLGQAFQMMTGPVAQQLVANSENRLTQLLKSGCSQKQMIDDLYWSVVTRAPTVVESERLVAHLREAADVRSGLEDVLWSLLNAKEFVLRR